MPPLPPARRPLALLLALATFAPLSARVLAQNGAAAEMMFDRGVKAMEAGQFDVACPALAESQRLEPRLGTLYALAECEAQQGKLASAVAHYSDYLGQSSTLPAAQAAKHTDRRKHATEQVTALRPRVPQLTLHPPAGGPFEIYLDDVRVGAPMLDLPVPVDPGAHRWRLRTSDGRESTGEATLAPAQKLTLNLELPAAPAPTVTTSAPPPPPESAVAPVPPPPPPAPRYRKAAYVTGGAGLVVLGAGVVTGVLALQQKKTIDRECMGRLCSQDGLDAVDRARTLGTISTIGVAVGAGAVAAGVVLYVVGTPRSQAASGALGVGPGQLWWQGSF